MNLGTPDIRPGEADDPTKIHRVSDCLHQTSTLLSERPGISGNECCAKICRLERGLVSVQEAALQRGINVGRSKRIPMGRLRQLPGALSGVARPVAGLVSR